MEKIIYNNKCKKLLAICALIVMLFMYIFPSIVMAQKDIQAAIVGDPVKTEAGNMYYEVKGSIQEVMNSLCYSRDYIDSNSEQHTIADKVGILNIHSKEVENLENIAKKNIDNWIDQNFPDIINYVKQNNLADFSNALNNDEEIKEICLNKIYNDNRNDGSKIEITCYLVSQITSEGVNWYIQGGDGNKGFSSKINLNVSDVKTTLAKSLSDIGDVDSEIGQTVSKEDDGIEEDSGDLGGILLSPVFYLVNFIADAITSNLGRIMIGDDASFANVTGTKILQDDIITPDPNKDYYEVDANMESNLFGTIQYPNIPYTPEEIFAGKIDLLSIDFISGKNYEGNENENSGWISIRRVISQWYQILRMVGIIGLLSVLLYTGIKIIISANANDKAKYKEWIVNWFMAVAILFAMHYIMAFIISVTTEFSKLLGQASEGIIIVNGNDRSATNLMGLVRFMIQSENFYIKIGYEVMYIALIVYTIKFTIIYLKRVLNMAFLTLIAPIVALTYPIDKINDGKAQGFDMWLKEYIFNAVLQPMHLIMYYVLVGSATSIAASNPIYGIVVLMFMTEAEKLLKRIFGFDKASGGTVGGMAGAFAAGAIASSVKDIARMSKLPGGNSSKGSSNSSGNEAIDSPKPIDKPGIDVFGTEGGPNLETDTSIEKPKIGNNTERNNNPSQFDLDENEGTSNDINSRENNEREEQLNNEEQPELFDEPLSQQPGSIDEPLNQQPESITKPKQDQISIRDMANKHFKGAKAVGKRLVRPAWDFDKSAKYNFKRIAKTAGRAAVGFSIGTAAAAVQAGISITDGKYSIGEGALAVSAGYAGGGQISKGIGSLVDTYKDGTLSDDPKERKQEMMKRAQERFGDRDDVIAFNKKNYPGQEKEMMQRQRDHYLPAGVTDLKEMKAGIKFADSLVGKTEGLNPEQIKAKRVEADRRAAATIDFRKTLQDQGQLKAVYDKDKREKYIQTMIEKVNNADEKAKLKRQYENAFKSVAAYDAVNS